MTAESHESNAPAGSGLSTYLSPTGAWAFALGTSIGWGSLVVTSQAYLSQAGPYGSVIGIVIGMFVMVIIALCYHFLMVNNTSDGGIYGITGTSLVTTMERSWAGSFCSSTRPCCGPMPRHCSSSRDSLPLDSFSSASTTCSLGTTCT